PGAGWAIDIIANLMNFPRFPFHLLLAGFLLAVFAPSRTLAAAQQTSASALTGVVKDASGGAIPGALVIARIQPRGEQPTVAGPDGQFRLDLPVALPVAADVELIVRAGGFAEHHQRASAGARDLSIVLEPAALLETVVVTATRSEQRLGDVPASVNVLTKE